MAEPLKLFDAPLTADFQATGSFMIQGDRFAVDFDLTVAAGDPAQVEWYVELTSDPTGDDPTWRREVAENNQGIDGVTNMPKVVRVFREADESLLAEGEHHLSVPLHRSHQFGRLQMRLADGAATRAVVYAPFGQAVVAP